MSLRIFWYMLTEGIKSFLKNRFMTLASITTIGASLLVIGVFYSLAVNIDYILDKFEQNIGIAVFFEENVTENEILTLKNQLEKLEAINEVNYISEESAWETFKNEYFEGREALLEGFGDDNPLKGSASLQVLFSDITKQGEVVDYLEGNEIVRHIRETREVTDVMKDLSRLVMYVSFILILLLSIVSLFIIANTIRLAIALRKNEIQIMRYIGAKNIMIRGPFLVEGIIIGLVGALIPLAVIYAFYDRAAEWVNSQFYLLRDFLVFLPVEQIVYNLIPYAFGIGALLGFLGSLVTVGRYLKA